MTQIRYAIIGLALLGATASSRAAQSIFDFNSGNLNTGLTSNSIGATQSGFTLVAYGFNADNTPHNLYLKDLGSDEHGIGLTGTDDNELTLMDAGANIANYIQIDVGAIQAGPTAQLKIGSNTDDESFDLFGSNTLGLLGTKILNASTLNDVFFDIPNWGTYRYIGVAVHPDTSQGGADNNVLVNAVAIPEPMTFSLVAGALGLLIGTGKRRAQKS
jgi:hypothetical protein